MLLDTNVWSYVADDDASDDLERLGALHGVEFLVTPTVVREQLRTTDRAVRERLLRVTTDDRWTRAMPEAFYACLEIINAVRRHRPHWILDHPSGTALRAFRENEQDWRRRFWSEALIAPDRCSARTRELDDASLELALTGLREGRRVAIEDKISLEDFSLDELGSLGIQSGQPQPLSPTVVWQYSSAVHVRDALFGPLADTTNHDWLSPYIDTAVARDEDDWFGFWSDLAPSDVPIHWTWWAGALCAQAVKVNSGAPTDINLTAYLTLPDAFVTADKRLHRITNKIHLQAPVLTAASFETTRDGWWKTVEEVSATP